MEQIADKINRITIDIDIAVKFAEYHVNSGNKDEAINSATAAAHWIKQLEKVLE